MHPQKICVCVGAAALCLSLVHDHIKQRITISQPEVTGRFSKLVYQFPIRIPERQFLQLQYWEGWENSQPGSTREIFHHWDWLEALPLWLFRNFVPQKVLTHSPSIWESAVATTFIGLRQAMVALTVSWLNDLESNLLVALVGIHGFSNDFQSLHQPMGASFHAQLPSGSRWWSGLCWCKKGFACAPSAFGEWNDTFVEVKDSCVFSSIFIRLSAYRKSYRYA